LQGFREGKRAQSLPSVSPLSALPEDDAGTRIQQAKAADNQDRRPAGGEGPCSDAVARELAQIRQQINAAPQHERGAQQGFDPVHFLRRSVERMRDDLQSARQQLQEAQREKHQLRAEQFQRVTEAKEEVRAEMSATVNELRRERDHAERERDRAQQELERKKYEDELRAKFEREFGPKEKQGAGAQIMDLVSSIASENGGEYVRQVLEIIKAQASGNAQGAAQIASQAAHRAQTQQNGEGGGQEMAAQNRAALQKALAQIESHQGDGGAGAGPSLEKPPQPPKPNETADRAPSDAKQQTMPHHQRRAPSDAEQPTASNAGAAQANRPAPAPAPEPEAGPSALTEQFANDLSDRVTEALAAGESAQTFAADARKAIAQLEAQGFEYSAPAFARLTEQIVKDVGGQTPTERVAELLAPFLTDLPPAALQGVKMLPPEKLKAGYIDPVGVDLGGHDDYLIDVLRELKSYL
jgi:hypothetical protein